MLIEYGIAILIAGVCYAAFLDWVRRGLNDVWKEHVLEQRGLEIGLWFVPLSGGGLLLLFYGARWVWWSFAQ